MTSKATQLISNVPLIKAPSFWVPKPVTLPNDIHPLPPDITAYFVYPHILENHVLSTFPHALDTLHDAQQQRDNCLKNREEEKKRKKKEALKRVAPGWEEGEGVLVPTKRSSIVGSPPIHSGEVEVTTQPSKEEEENDPVRQLVDGLEKLENLHGSKSTDLL